METPNPIVPTEPPLDGPTAFSATRVPIAGAWHTWLVLAVMALWGFTGIWRRSYFIAHPEFSHIPMYLRMLTAECAIAMLVAWGVHRAGGSLRDLLGRQWTSASDFFRDIGIAFLFWIIALIVTGAVRNALPAPPVQSPVQTSSPATEGGAPKSGGSASASSSNSAASQTHRPQANSRQSLRSRIPPILLRMAPRGIAEILVWFWVSLAAGICEEIVFRGYLQLQLAAWLGMPLGVVLSSTVFGLGHLYQGRNSAIAIGFYGLLLSLLTLYRKSLLPGILAHSWQDMVSGFLLGLIRR